MLVQSSTGMPLMLDGTGPDALKAGIWVAGVRRKSTWVKFASTAPASLSLPRCAAPTWLALAAFANPTYSRTGAGSASTS